MKERTERQNTKHQGTRVSRRGFLAAAGVVVAGAVAAPIIGAGWPSASVRPASAAGTFSVPAEDVPHARTWMAFPDRTAIWGRGLGGVQSDIARIATTIAKHEPVTLCANPASAARARSLCGSGVTVITDIPVDDCWMRDTGPVFRVDDSGALDAVGLNFNGWGGKQAHTADARVASRIASFVGVPFARADFVGEGGAIEQDGFGTLMATRSSLVNDNRNRGLSQQEIEDAMLDAYGASAVIWFDGVRGQDITDDHVYATSRFVAAGRGVVQLPHGSDDDAFARDARKQFSVLSAATTASGSAMTVSAIQGPDYDRIRSTSSSFLASYANYYVCNGAVIAGQFGDVRADAAAKAALAALFPGRVVEQVAIDHLGAGGGGIHCVTQQQPAM
ncbi:agmatine deiminase family protein [Leifsonia aquatica]|uniref:agmatine deiminase family protein n=1 Tax=Leifsonia aquatica TaxID=144185 RepID=UPI0004692BE9|nr:agmatine deiminase family protein [Leifsonia aquatica]